MFIDKQELEEIGEEAWDRVLLVIIVASVLVVAMVFKPLLWCWDNSRRGAVNTWRALTGNW